MRKEIKKYIELFNHTLNMSNLCWWIIDFKNDPEYFYCNEHMQEVFCLDKSLEKHSIADTCPIAGEYNKNIIDFDDNSLKKASIVFQEYKQLLNLKKDDYHNTFPYYNSELNKIEYFSSRAKVLEKDEKSEVSILFGIIENITVQETQKLQLKEAQSIAKLGSWSNDLINNEFSCTDEIYKILEINKNKNPYIELLKLIHEEDKNKVLEAHKKSIEKKESYEIVYRLFMKDKTIKWIKEQAKTIFNKDNKALIIIGTVQDITKEQEYHALLNKKDKQIYESHKLASMGEMLSNIAHQWRQPLSSISSLATGTILYCETGKANMQDIKNCLENITDITFHMSETINDFQNFFKPNEKFEEFTIDELIKKSLSIIKPILNIKYIKIEIENKSNCIIKGPLSEYIQIMMNIIINSKDAFENKIEEEKLIKIKTEKINGVCTIQIEDNAGGIPKNIIDRVFEPYFTTKHQSQGTGLGLYMSKEIMEKHLNGTIEVENIKDGAKFTIKIANEMCRI